MSAQQTDSEAEVNESEMLDAETSAALLRWMETGEVPDGIDRARWERWAGGGCCEPIDARGVAVTRAMLANWARTGTLR